MKDFRSYMEEVAQVAQAQAVVEAAYKKFLTSVKNFESNKDKYQEMDGDPNTLPAKLNLNDKDSWEKLEDFIYGNRESRDKEGGDDYFQIHNIIEEFGNALLKAHEDCNDKNFKNQIATFYNRVVKHSNYDKALKIED